MGRVEIIFIMLMSLSIKGHTQVISPSKRALSAYEDANSAIENREVSNAIRHLENALKHDPNFAEAHQILGDIYRQQRNDEKAILHYQHVANLKPYLTPNTWFGLGEIFLRMGKYQRALDHLAEYKKRFPQHAENNKWTQNYIDDCNFSLNYAHPETQVENKRLNAFINSEFDEYFPQLTADQKTMIFTRKVNNLESFYESLMDNEGRWGESQLLHGEINSSQYNEGAHCISPDGKYLYFTGCNRPGGMGSCDIYVSKRGADGWGKPQNLGPPINTSGWEAQPALSADGRALYFVSNRKGGIGGYDIWKTTRLENGQWAPPTNLGPKINTEFDESSPFIHADNTSLYFSSNGWPGFGDKDLFKSNLDRNGQWGTPVNLGATINNHLEQNAISVGMSGQVAYYSSVTVHDKNDLDIFEISLDASIRPQPVAYINGLVTDVVTNKPLQAHVLILDLLTEERRFEAYSDLTDGTFLAPLTQGNSYALHVSHPGYLFYSENYSLDEHATTKDVFELRVKLQAIKAGHTEILNNVFFDINESILLEESKHELFTLIEFLNQNPNLAIEIGGHTDATGSAIYNQELSTERAKSVWSFLKTHGIGEERILYQGYGQNQPIADNNTEEGRQLNRRTAFKIISLI